MKIGIITQPLHINYGGLLQNYALQRTLLKLGHEVHTINRYNVPTIYTAHWKVRLKFRIKQLIKKYIGREYVPSYKGCLTIRQHCIEFVKNNITTTTGVNNSQELQEAIKRYDFEGYVVGSDQVWRPMYSGNIYNDFLDFCQEQKRVKIAYAASFGVSEWEFNEEQTKECSRLVKLFDAVSVREDSGIELCNNYFGIEAVHLLDPTLLLEKEEYIKLVEKNGEQESEGDLFCYILDNNEAIKSTIGNIEERLSLKKFYVKEKKSSQTLRIGDNINDHIVPSPIKWLRAFMDAKMVFTDSFHGCVFSIIFNKPFWVIGNKERGNARFESLLKLFGLEERRIALNEIGSTDLSAEINWVKVNAIKKEWQAKSIKFLEDNLQ